MDSIEARVARGAALLDEQMPGWEREINLGTLDMKSGVEPRHLADDATLIASWYGTQFLGLRSLDEHRRHGFLSYALLTNPTYQAEYAALDVAWRALIKERFASGTLSDER